MSINSASRCVKITIQRYTPIESQVPERPIPYDPNVTITDQIQLSFQIRFQIWGPINLTASILLHDMLDRTLRRGMPSRP